jgi:Family of unknown function (DUF5343)
MSVQQGTRMPYASTGSIKTVIEKHRQVGLPAMSQQRLQQIGVTEALAPRTLQALIFLGFYDENGKVTPEFDALQHAESHDFKLRLAALLRAAYAPVLEVLDTDTATTLDIENAFRGSVPTGQLPRMVQLFIGLMTYAEVMPEPETKRRTGGGSGQAVSRPPKHKPDGERGRSRRPAVNSGHERQLESPPVKPTSHMNGKPGERRDISLGDAGSVSVIVNVRWLDLPEEQFTKLRKLIKDIEALGDSGPDNRDLTEVTP